MAALAGSPDQIDIDSAVWSGEIQRPYNKHELTCPCVTFGSLKEGCRQVWTETTDAATPLVDERGWGQGRGGEKGRKGARGNRKTVEAETKLGWKGAIRWERRKEPADFCH